MEKRKQEGLGDELFGTRLGEWRDASGPTKGGFVPPPDVSDKEEIEEALPEEEEFWRPLLLYVDLRERVCESKGKVNRSMRLVLVEDKCISYSVFIKSFDFAHPYK